MSLVINADNHTWIVLKPQDLRKSHYFGGNLDHFVKIKLTQKWTGVLTRLSWANFWHNHSLTFRTLWMRVDTGGSPSRSKTSNSSPKSQNSWLQMWVLMSFRHMVSLVGLLLQSLSSTYLPAKSFGVCHNELDSVLVAEITESLLIVQWGVGEHHHLEETSDRNQSELQPSFIQLYSFNLHPTLDSLGTN